MTCARELTLALGGQWYGRYGAACCPAHGDRNPSPSLADATDGHLLAKCHAGCSFETVIFALGTLGLVDGTGPMKLSDPAELARRCAAEAAEAVKRETQGRGTRRRRIMAVVTGMCLGIGRASAASEVAT